MTNPLVDILNEHALNNSLVKLFTAAGSFKGMLQVPDVERGIVILNNADHRTRSVRLNRELILRLDSIQAVSAYQVGMSPTDTLPWG